ncbi:MAG: Flp pilus assembly protein CpaB [Actinomycetota bacterium]
MPPAAATSRIARLALMPRRLLRRHYRLLAALLLCAAAALVVHQFTPAPAPTDAVVVAAADLPAGTVLSAGDIALAELPAGAVPDGTADSTLPLVGQRLATALRAGSPVFDTSIVGPGLLAGAPQGTVAVPVRPADPSTVQLVSPGQLVDIVLSSGNGFDEPAGSTVLARAVPVLWKADDGGASPALLGSQEPDGLVVVAAAPSDATALAGASSRGNIFLVLVG